MLGDLMKRRVRISLWILGISATVVGALTLYTLVEPRGHRLYSTPILVVGRVVDARSGQAIQDATVYVLGGGTQAAAEKDLAGLLQFAADCHVGSEDYGPLGAITATDTDGHFNVTLGLTYCCAFGPWVERRHPPTFHGARMILVEKDGYVRSFFPTSAGTWRVLEAGADQDVYAVADVQTLRLRPSK